MQFTITCTIDNPQPGGGLNELRQVQAMLRELYGITQTIETVAGIRNVPITIETKLTK